MSLAAVLSLIRTIALEDDVVYLDTPRWPGTRLAPLAEGWLGRQTGYFRFSAPSFPSSHPERVMDPGAHQRVRFVVRAHARGAGASRGAPANAQGPFPTSACEPGWRSILKLRDFVVLERDTLHGRERPLRLGLNGEEMSRVLVHARKSAEHFLAGGAGDTPGSRVANDHPRLSQRSAVAVALWTRGRLRGSVITSPGPALRMVAQGAAWACQDARFPPLAVADLAETIVQVGFLHAPRVPLSRGEIETGDAYPDKALFLSDGTRAGAYMPEVFNVFGRRMARLRALAESLARDKVGLPGLGPSARIEVSEVTEMIESADRSRALRLDGPVACLDDTSVRSHVPAAGRAACAWLAAIQGEDGALPLFVRPSTGKGEGVDIVRSAMTAEALAAFGVAYGLESALESARRILAWLDRSRSDWISNRVLALPATIYRGKAAWHLGDHDALEVATRRVLQQLDGPDPGPLVLAHAASFLDCASTRYPPAGRKCESLRIDLALQFAYARASEKPMSLAEWAELGAAFPEGSKTSREVCDWLLSSQLSSGAFPETTTSEFVYSRGTGKVFEVLALRARLSPGVIERALGWLLSMQYRPDSAFFVPHEHWSRVLGGLRHDPYGPDAWIDAAGHLLLGLARLGEQ